MYWHMLMIIVTNAFWEGRIESLKCIFNWGPKSRVLLNTFSLNLSESQCEESIGFQNRLESGHNTTGSETYFCRKGKHFKHQGASLSALITQWVILPLQQIPLPNLDFIPLLTLLHMAPSAEFKFVSCKPWRLYSPLLIIISELCPL